MWNWFAASPANAGDEGKYGTGTLTAERQSWPDTYMPAGPSAAQFQFHCLVDRDAQAVFWKWCEHTGIWLQ